MPEARTMERGEITGGFFLRRVASPAAAVRGPRRLALAKTGEDKENLPPWGPGASWRRRRRTVKSPLPDWYPRTPLRDITAIVNALERRRLRVQAAVRAAQTSNNTEETTQPPHLTSPSPQELSASDQTPLTDSTPIPNHKSPNTSLSPIEHPLPSAASSDCPSHTPSSSTDQSTGEMQADAEERLCRSIDLIEKIVSKNLKKEVKKEPAAKRAAQRKTLMSMR